MSTFSLDYFQPQPREVMFNPDEYTVENVPVYAVCYLVNDDPSGLSEKDIIAIDKWCEYLRSEGYDATVFDFQDEEPQFSSCPAFGLPCNCYETKIYKRC